MPLSRLVLSSARAIDLVELRLSSVYDGMLEGYPCKRVNDMKINSLCREAESSFPGLPVHLVPPVLARPKQADGPFGPVELLPDVACIGRFRSSAIDPDCEPVLHRSALIGVWFQAAGFVPSQGDAPPGLCEIPWDEVARDYEL